MSTQIAWTTEAEMEPHVRQAASTVVLVRSGKNLVPVQTRDILWLEAAGNYVRIHTSGTAYIARASLNSVVEMLDSDMFIRIHKSAAINIHALGELQPWFSGQMRVVLVDGTVLTLSRKFRPQFAARVPFLI